MVMHKSGEEGLITIKNDYILFLFFNLALYLYSVKRTLATPNLQSTRIYVNQDKRFVY